MISLTSGCADELNVDASAWICLQRAKKEKQKELIVAGTTGWRIEALGE